MARSDADARVVTPALLRRWPLPHPGDDGDKIARGSVLVIGGCSEIPGAVLLAATAALRAGAGRVQVATVRSVAPALAVALPEARVIALAQTRSGAIGARGIRAIADTIAHADAVLLGPGMPTGTPVAPVLAAVLEAASGTRLVLDAGVLDVLCARAAQLRDYSGGVVLTPHAREMAAALARPLAKVEADPPASARDAAREFGAIALLKGAVTWIATPDGALYCNRGVGNVGLGTSGSGDTLAGLIAGFAARGAEPLRAAVWGVHVHARAGDLLARRHGQLGYLAREIAPEVPALLRKLQARAR